MTPTRSCGASPSLRIAPRSWAGSRRVKLGRGTATVLAHNGRGPAAVLRARLSGWTNVYVGLASKHVGTEPQLFLSVPVGRDPETVDTCTLMTSRRGVMAKGP